MNQVIFEVSNLTTKVICTGNCDVHQYLHEQMREKKPGYWFADAYKKGFWDGTIKFFNKGIMDTGLISWALQLLRDGNFKDLDIKIKDVRVRCVERFKFKDNIELQGFQREILDQCLRSTRGFVAAATGCGKTEIFMHLISELGVPALVLVNSVDLVSQTIERMLGAYDAKGLVIREISGGKATYHGDIDKGTYTIPKAQITVATIQTLYKKGGMLTPIDFGVKISDECHGVAADTWHAVMSRFNTYYSFGFSGSLIEDFEDKVRYRKIMGATGREIINVPASYLIDAGILAKPEIRIIKFDGGRHTGMPYLEEYTKAVVGSAELNTGFIPALVKHHSSDKLLILVDKIQHGNNLYSSTGIPFVHGETAKSVRINMLRKLKEGKIRHLIASKIFQAGIDIPDLNVIISATLDKGYKALLQRLGRGMRKCEGKDSVIYYDFYIQTGGFVEKHAKERIRKYKKLGFDYSIRDCSSLIKC